MIETFDVTATPATCFTTTESAGNITITDYLIGNEGCTTAVVIPSVIGEKPVTGIGNDAFRSNRLISVTIPDSVTSIGNYAFYYSELTSVTIPDPVISIGNYAFYYSQLTSLTLGTGVTSIGDYAFGSNKLTSVTIPSSVTSIGTRAFGSNQLTSVTLGSGVTSIGISAFIQNKLTSVTIPDSVTSIGEYAFSNNPDTDDPQAVKGYRAAGTAGISVAANANIVVRNATSTTSLSGAVVDKEGDPTKVLVQGQTDSEAQLTGTLLDGTSYAIPVDAEGSFSFELAKKEVTEKITLLAESEGKWRSDRLVLTISALERDPDNQDIPGACFDTTESGGKITITDYRRELYPECNSTGMVIPQSIGGKPVTSIGNYAFTSNQLASVVIPNSVTSIGDGAFYGNQLTSVTIPSGSIGYAAFGNNKLTSVTLGTGVISIGQQAFQSNDQLTSIAIPNGNIQDRAFQSNKLISVTLGTGVTSIGQQAFYNNQLISATILSGSIGEQAFYGNQLSSLTLGTGVTNIGRQAFYNNDQLTSVTIPSGSIGEQAFYGNQLTSVTLGTGVTSIGELAFYGNQLTSVTLGTGVTSIGEQAFYGNQLISATILNGSIGRMAFGNNQLSSLTLGTGVTSIGELAFLSNKLTSVTIPNSVTSIGNYAFYSNQLTSVTLGTGVTSIGEQAFYSNKLTSVTIPNSVTSIGTDAFSYNELTSVTLGTGVATIGTGAFRVNQLTSVIMQDGVTSIGQEAFRNNQLRSLTIPDSVTNIGNNAFANNPQVVKGYRAAGTAGITVAANANILVRDWTSTTSLSGTVVDKEGDPTKVLIQGQTDIGAQLTGTLIEGGTYTITADAEGSFSFELAKTEVTDKIALVADSGVAGKRGSDTLVLTIPALDSANQEIPTACFVTSLSGGKITITDYKAGVYPECIAEVVIPESIGENPVTSIGTNAFSYNQLTSVIIPGSVTSIGDNAFERNQLASLILGTGVISIGYKAFYDNQLTAAIIPNSVTSIGNYAFTSNQLASVVIPNSVTSIGTNVFSSNQLTSITIPNSVTSIGNYAFINNQLNSVTIPNSVMSIGNYAFSSNQLTSAIIPNGSIGERVFGNNQLTSVTLGTGVTSIGNYAFYSNKLTSVTIPNSVTSIGNNAFSYNELTSVTLGTGITSIGYRTFSVNKLTSVTIPDSVTSIETYAFLWNPGVVKGYRVAGATGITIASNANIVVKAMDTAIATSLMGQVVNKPQDPVVAIVQGETESGAQIKGTLPDETTYTAQADGQGKFALEVPKKDVPDQITLVADSGEGKWRSDPLTLTIPAIGEEATNGNENEETPSKTGQSGGGGTILVKKNPCTEANCAEIPSSGAEAKDPETIVVEDDISSSPSKGEMQELYTRAYENGLTTMPSLEAARFDDAIIRAEFAKVISVYATQVLNKEILEKEACKAFTDIKEVNEELQGYITQACNLGLMGYRADGLTVKKEFTPYGELTRAEVGTILSRLLRGNTYNAESEDAWYENHLLALNKEKIINDISQPFMKELRGNVFLMLRRM
ncbi:MAG: leucine-rich repeat domain-containing protein [Candidatus Absconditabacteria bacterium]|nr:leucine-rich repeat domain-containing protein [Candidatus Absconditabacteria bacterium]